MYDNYYDFNEKEYLEEMEPWERHRDCEYCYPTGLNSFSPKERMKTRLNIWGEELFQAAGWMVYSRNYKLNLKVKKEIKNLKY